MNFSTAERESLEKQLAQQLHTLQHTHEREGPLKEQSFLNIFASMDELKTNKQVTKVARRFPNNVAWQAAPHQVLDPVRMEAQARTMSTWIEFTNAVAPFGSPMQKSSRELPTYTQRAVRRRGLLTDEAIAGFRLEQERRLIKIAAAHAHEPKPRWHLLQKLASASGCEDRRLDEHGCSGCRGRASSAARRRQHHNRDGAGYAFGTPSNGVGT